ncbi:hypothetical protein SAMN05518855_101244 [Paenibacillus sp. CF384]|nr:hypothetical protein SAMN05518855_101244 [Paenibacillus sp. CF384]
MNKMLIYIEKTEQRVPDSLLGLYGCNYDCGKNCGK